MRFKVVAVGGTFDEFHKGHRILLKKAFEVSERVIIGLSADDLVQKMEKPHKIATYDVRLEELKSFLWKNGWTERAKIVPLHTPYGLTLTSKVIQGIVVSRETEPRAREINEKRIAKGLPPLVVIVVEMVPADDTVPISTTRIRFYEIDREGHLLRHEHEY
jgi:pantetheine-phosphate adenylyltransferase